MIWKGPYHKDWQRKFALFPVSLSDKTVIWLEFYFQRYVEDTCLNEQDSKCINCSFIVGHWEKSKEKLEDA